MVVKGGYLHVHTRSLQEDRSVRFLFGFSLPVYTADVKRQRLPAVQLVPTNSLFLAWGVANYWLASVFLASPFIHPYGLWLRRI